MSLTKKPPLPSFLCIGSQKAATSWLWTMLRQHPEIWMSPLKEIHFFDHLYDPKNTRWRIKSAKKQIAVSIRQHLKGEKIDFKYLKYLVNLAVTPIFTESWYSECFNRPEAIGKSCGEITPAYSTLSEEGVEYVKKFLGPDLKLIYIIRNPLDRAVSHLKMKLTRGKTDAPDNATILKMAHDPEILKNGNYQQNIPRWEKYFPRENFLYLPYKEVRTDPAGFLSQIEDHLAVSRLSKYRGSKERVHKTKEVEIPGNVLAYLKKELAPQNEFLIKRFGEDWFSRT